MHEEIERDSDTRFFVATDAPEEEALLHQEFPGRIISHAKASLSRNDPRGIKDALIDLYCLAHCRKLIGSHLSSFTEVAANIRGIDCIIAMAGKT